MGLIAVIAAALVLIESSAGQDGARADAMSKRLTSDVTTRLVVSAGPFDFRLRKSLQATVVGLEGTSRQLVALEDADPAADAIGAADLRASKRLVEIAAAMGAPPDGSSPLDGYARMTLASTLDEMSAIVVEQNRQRDLADAASARSSQAVLGLSLLALGGVLAGLAALVGSGRAGNVLLLIAYLMAGAGAAVGLVAVVVMVLPKPAG